MNLGNFLMIHQKVCCARGKGGGKSGRPTRVRNGGVTFAVAKGIV